MKLKTNLKGKLGRAYKVNLWTILGALPRWMAEQHEDIIDEYGNGEGRPWLGCITLVIVTVVLLLIFRG